MKKLIGMCLCMLFLMACNDVDDWVEHSEKLDLPQVYSVTEMPYSKLKKYCNGDEYLLTEMQVRGGWIFDQSLKNHENYYNPEICLSEYADYYAYYSASQMYSDEIHSVFWFENQSFECDKLYYWAQIYSFSYNYSHPGLLDDILMDQSNSRSIYSDFASISVKDARQICNVQMWRDWQYEEETGMEVEGWRCNLDWSFIPSEIASYGICLNETNDLPELSNSQLLTITPDDYGYFSDLWIPYNVYGGYYARVYAIDSLGNVYYSPVYKLGEGVTSRSGKDISKAKEEVR